MTYSLSGKKLQLLTQHITGTVKVKPGESNKPQTTSYTTLTPSRSPLTQAIVIISHDV